MPLRQAQRKYDAPWGSLHRAWVGLEGNINGEKWEAFKASCPQPAQDAADKDDEDALPGVESPLGPRLKRRANRYGDAVPYGNHGAWGLYREGVKEMTVKISTGKLTPAEACSLLAAENVHVSERSLEERARKCPGKSPVKAGRGTLLLEATERQIHTELDYLRTHDIPLTKQMSMNIATSLIQGTDEAKKFKNGRVSDDWYYGFLDRWDMNTGDTKPLESDRDLWLTSEVAPSLLLPIYPISTL